MSISSSKFFTFSWNTSRFIGEESITFTICFTFLRFHAPTAPCQVMAKYLRDASSENFLLIISLGVNGCLGCGEYSFPFYCSFFFGAVGLDGCSFLLQQLGWF